MVCYWPLVTPWVWTETVAGAHDPVPLSVLDYVPIPHRVHTGPSARNELRAGYVVAQAGKSPTPRDRASLTAFSCSKSASNDTAET